jgi:hypothetical protein
MSTFGKEGESSPELMPGSGNYNDPDFGRFVVDFDNDLITVRTLDGQGVLVYTGTEYAKFVRGGKVPDKHHRVIHKAISEHFAKGKKVAPALAGATLVPPFGVLISSDPRERSAIFRSEITGEDTQISLAMAETIIATLAKVGAMNGVLAKNAIYALRGGAPAESSPDDTVEIMAKAVRAADDPLKAAGEWVTAVTLKAGELIREMDEENES